ncbi:MAG TPA: DUF305 domain-containing protein [Gaiellaceae bacterium]|nr:DUF305 domain-containing protein [Gaiellaceae bacterium]
MSKLAVLLAAVALLAAGCGGDDDAAQPSTGEGTVASGQVPFDQAFIDAMVPHHREAIEMAKAANSRGLTEPELETIANDIISSQQREIDEMLEWREEWFGSPQLGPVLPEVLGVAENELGMEHGSADEIAGAVDVDTRFAEMMIPHHEGAIAMAEQAAERGQHDEVRDLAGAIISAQKREIGIMEEHASGMDHG